MILQTASKAIFTSFLILAISQFSFAANISIRPVKVVFDSANKTAVLSISNQSDEPALFQSSFKEWEIIGGDSHFIDTEDIVASPPIFTVPGKSTQTIRLAILTTPTEVERSYRIFLEQIPNTDSTGQTQGLKVAMNFSLPVFVSPADSGEEQGEISWLVHRQSEDRYFLQASNNTSRHTPVSEVRLLDEGQKLIAEQSKHQYLLPGSTLFWELENLNFSKSPEFIQAKLGTDTVTYTIRNVP